MEVIQEINKVSKFRPIEGVLLELYNIVLEKNINRKKATDLFIAKGHDNFKLSYKRLKDKLLEGILYNSFSELTKVQKQHIDLSKKYTEARILIKLHQKNAGIKIAEETLRKAEQLGDLEIALSLCRELEVFFALGKSPTPKYKKYQLKSKVLKQAFDEEFEMQQLYSAMMYADKHKKDLSSYYEELIALAPIAKANENYRFRLYYHHSINRMADRIGDTDLFIKNTRAAISFFNSSKVPLPYVTRWIFLINLLPIYIKQGEFLKIERTLNECLKLPSKGSLNWHLTLQYKAVYGFYSDNPKMALNAYQTAHNLPKKFENSGIDDKWLIIRAYLAFYHKVGRIKFPEEFRLRRFLNSMPPTKNDHHQRANLLVLEFIHLLADNNLKDYTQKTFPIEDTIYKYFNKHSMRRTKYFLHCLRSVVKGNFTKPGTARHAVKYLVKINHFKGGLDSDSLEREIVPYDLLWEEVLLLIVKKYNT